MRQKRGLFRLNQNLDPEEEFLGKKIIIIHFFLFKLTIFERSSQGILKGEVSLYH